MQVVEDQLDRLLQLRQSGLEGVEEAVTEAGSAHLHGFRYRSIESGMGRVDRSTQIPGQHDRIVVCLGQLQPDGRSRCLLGALAQQNGLTGPGGRDQEHEATVVAPVEHLQESLAGYREPGLVACAVTVVGAVTAVGRPAARSHARRLPVDGRCRNRSRNVLLTRSGSSGSPVSGPGAGEAWSAAMPGPRTRRGS